MKSTSGSVPVSAREPFPLLREALQDVSWNDLVNDSAARKCRHVPLQSPLQLLKCLCSVVLKWHIYCLCLLLFLLYILSRISIMNNKKISLIYFIHEDCIVLHVWVSFVHVLLFSSVIYPYNTWLVPTVRVVSVYLKKASICERDTLLYEAYAVSVNHLGHIVGQQWVCMILQTRCHGGN